MDEFHDFRCNLFEVNEKRLRSGESKAGIMRGRCAMPKEEKKLVQTVWICLLSLISLRMLSLIYELMADVSATTTDSRGSKTINFVVWLGRAFSFRLVVHS